ncbi:MULTISPECIES: TonB-dependent receptor domain-containing protein [Butyricimonas]|uniref:TonB-dependent receptor domain-containing protein n=1 Tax=Butyricimonas TaxID=574697 RepID=UPI0024315586|nr:TonB-dependent receptor [Butyricimonas paravirosa]
MKKGILFLILFFLVVCKGTGQILQGYVKTLEEKPVSQAHVILLNSDLKVVAHAVSGDDGFFLIQAVEKGMYKLNISCVGFEILQQNILIEGNRGDLGVFRIKEGITLDEVTVIKHKKSLTTKVDRIIYDVEQDSMAKNSVAMQILEKLPFVNIDLKTKQLQVMGETNFVITINGKKNLFLSEANQYVARLLQGDKMKQVELITSPQGQYSDKTAVINIVTKGSLPDGIVGNIMIDFGKDFIKPNLGVTSKIGKLVYNVNYQPGYTYYSELTDKTKVINYRDDTIHRTESELITWSKDDSHELQLNASYDFSDNDLLTFTGQYTYYREREFQEGKTTIWNKKDNKVQIYSFENRNINREERWNGKINYQKSFRNKEGRLFTATYGVENNQGKKQYGQELTGMLGIEDSRGIFKNSLRLTEHTTGVDFTNPINEKHSYFLTAKLVARQYRSDEELNYDQYVPAFRASYSFSTVKMSLRAEVSFEKTINDMQFSKKSKKVRKNFFNVTPSASAIFLLSRKSTFSILYSVPSFRPDIYYLNPFVDRSDPSHWKVGNPDLEPEISQLLSMSYRFYTEKTSLAFSAKYKHSGNAIYPYDYTNETGALVTTYRNMNRSEMLSFNMNFEYKVPDKLQIWCTGEAKYTYYSITRSNFPLWNFKAAAGVYVTLFKKATLGIIGNIRPMSTSVQHTKFEYLTTATLRGEYAFTSKLSFLVDMDKFLWKHINVENVKETDSFYYDKDEQWRGRWVSFTLVYNFGRLCDRVKKSGRGVKNEDRVKEI